MLPSVEVSEELSPAERRALSDAIIRVVRSVWLPKTAVPAYDLGYVRKIHVNADRDVSIKTIFPKELRHLNAALTTAVSRVPRIRLADTEHTYEVIWDRSFAPLFELTNVDIWTQLFTPERVVFGEHMRWASNIVIDNLWVPGSVKNISESGYLLGFSQARHVLEISIASGEYTDELVPLIENMFMRIPTIRRVTVVRSALSPNPPTAPARGLDDLWGSLPPLPHSHYIPLGDELKQARSDAEFGRLLALYESVNGSEHADWLSILGCAYGSTGHQWHDDTKCHALLLASAQKKSPAGCFNLAKRWADGHFGRIDIARALHWYERAHEAGNVYAAAQIFSLMFRDPRFKRDEQYRQAAISKLVDAYDARAPNAIVAVAKAGLESPDESLRVGYERELEAIAEVNFDEDSATSASFHLALRHLIGAGVKQDFAAAKAHITRCISLHERSPSRTDANIRYFKMVSQQTDKGPDEECDRILLNIQQRKVSSQNICSQIEDGSIKAIDTLAERLQVLGLLMSEHAEDRETITQIKSAIEIRSIGVSRDQLRNSTFDFGPNYNVISNNGFPLPGKFKKFEESGFGEFVGLTATVDGLVSPHFRIADQVVGPLLLTEDVDVALALAFGDQNVIWPSLSLEDVSELGARAEFCDLNRKDWDPDWLGHTRFGKTLYAADYLMGAIAWANDVFVTDQNLNPAADRLLAEINCLGGRQFGISTRIMLQPRVMGWEWSRLENGDVSCSVNRLTFGVLGAQISVSAEGIEDRSVHVNDSRFVGGRLGNYLTDNFDALCSQWPVFERARQLTAMTTAFNELSQKGFKPNLELKERVQSTLTRYTGRSIIPLHQRLSL